MSSWKHYGGINNLAKINTNSLSVNSLLMKEPFVGVFNISGGLIITGNAGNTNLYNNLNVYLNSTFYGPATFNQSFTALGNIDSSQSANISNNIVLGNILYFDNGKSQFIYGNSSGLGINTTTPNAALDISTNLVKGFNIYSNNMQNINTLAQNSQQNGLQIGVDSSSSFIHFFHDHTIESGIIDGNISFNDGGMLNIDVSQNINLLTPVSISDRGSLSHVNRETVVIYDISNGPFFGNIYTATTSTSTSGSALSLISNDTSSNTFMYITTPNKKGFGIGGGAYPDDLNKSMGTIGMVDTSGTYTPTQIFVSGNNKVKYKTTTGINTFKPRIDNYVLDINGPIHIDNGDITNVTGNINFELYSMSLARTYPNNLLALGSPYDTGTYNNNIIFKERVLKSIDYGKTWNIIDLSYADLLSVNGITSIHMYDQSYCFLTGQNNYLRYSIDGGINWNRINTGLNQNIYNYFFVNPKQNDTNDNIFCYFSVDLSSTFFSFKTNITEKLLTKQTAIFLNNPDPYIISCKDYINSINGIHGYDKTLYVAGNAIVKYNIDTTKYQTNDTSWTSYAGNHNYSTGSYTYIYNGIYAFDNSFVIAVGNNIISSTTDGGSNWNDISLNSMNGGNGVNLKSVFIYDSSYAVSVGSYGNIWVTNNSGLTWNYMPSNLINSSGKSSLITSNNNNFKHVIMPDINTMIISNIITPFKVSDNKLSILQNGISNIYNVFIPNFVNRSNNIVLDISGTVNISGDLKMSDNGDFVSNNPTMNIFNKNVKTINFGRATETINVGNTLLGNTIIQNNLITNGNATFIDTIQVNQTSLLNGNIGINIKPTNYTLDISGNIYSRSGLYVFNKLGVNTTTPNYDVDISGILNVRKNLFVLSDVSMNANVYVKGNSVYDSFASFNSGIFVKQSDVTVTGNIYGNIYPIGTNSLTIGGSNNDIYIGGENTKRSPNIYIGQGVYSNQNFRSYINVGAEQDYVYMRGNTTFYQLLQQEVTSSTIVVNKYNIGANASSGGAGIDIFDNSNANINGISSKIYGYIHVGRDLQSFVFKAPSYGAYEGSVPRPKTNYDLSLISQENRVRLGVNELKLAQNKYIPTSGIVRSGLLILQTNQDFINYQGSHSYYNDANLPDADYAINISNAFDISNIMLKLFDTVSGTQSIGSNLVIGNSSIPYDLSVYGNSTINGNSAIYGNVIISGNLNAVRDASFNGNLIVGGTTLSTSIGTGAVIIKGGVGIAGNVFIGGNLNAVRDASFNGNLIVGGATVSNSITSGAVIITGGVGIGGNVFIGGNLNAVRDASFNGNLNVGGSITGGAITGTGATIGTSTRGIIYIGDSTNGLLLQKDTTDVYIRNLQTSGNLYLGTQSTNSVRINAEGLKITSTTSSSSITTGALVVSGGVGISGNLYLPHDTGQSNGIVWGVNFSKIYDNGDLHIYTDDNMHFDISATTDVLKIQWNLITSKVKIEALSFNATSDYRLKQNVQLLNETNKSVDELKPIEYDLSGGNHDMGFLAHEVQEIFPFLVNGEKDGKEFQSINYNGFIALLVKEIQDLKKEMKILYDKNNELDKRNDELDKRNDELDKRLKLVENK